jgi:mono/diheme cytochrome c family protein
MKSFLLIFVCAFLVNCSCDQNETKLTYMPDMAWNPIVKPYREYLLPPEHSVAMNAMLYPETDEEAEESLINPLVGMSFAKQGKSKYLFSQTDLDSGKERYNDYCYPCHGTDGKGRGPIKEMVAPDLTNEFYQDKKDGFFFQRITFGHTIMPAYGYALDIDERWQIVLYLRNTLQRKY